jgi:hypothetical protein
MYSTFDTRRCAELPNWSPRGLLNVGRPDAVHPHVRNQMMLVHARDNAPKKPFAALKFQAALEEPFGRATCFFGLARPEQSARRRGANGLGNGNRTFLKRHYEFTYILGIVGYNLPLALYPSLAYSGI